MKRAFTLIELTVVIVLIAIVSALIVVEMSGSFQDALLRSTGRQLISVFDLASSRAVSRHRLHRVQFDRLQGRYQVQTRTRGHFVPLEDLAGGEGTVDLRIHLRINATEPDAAEADAISFYPDGTADAREVELRDKDGFGLALRVNPVTARVDIMELERK